MEEFHYSNISKDLAKFSYQSIYHIPGQKEEVRTCFRAFESMKGDPRETKS